MPIEFLGIAGLNDGGETHARTGTSFDKDYTLRFARAHEDNGWDRILFAYHSGSPDPATGRRVHREQADTLQILLAHRPNVAYPTYAAKMFATLDQISDGRLAVHFITGGSTADQAAEGDFLTKDERYARTREYIQHRQAGVDDARAVRSRRRRTTGSRTSSPTSSPCSSRGRTSRSADPRRRVRGRRRGGRHLRLWGEPLAEHRRADRRRSTEAAAGGRPHDPASDPGRLPPDHRADRRARVGEGRRGPRRDPATNVGAPRSARPCSCGTGERRVAATARDRERGERYDRALWTAPAGHPAVAATPTRWSAPRRRSRPRCSTTSTSASTSSRLAATTSSTTRSISAATSSRSCARKSPSVTPRRPAGAPKEHDRDAA